MLHFVRISFVLVLALALVGATGCVYHDHAGYHVHEVGCGHYYWHGGWYNYPHPATCSICYPGPAVVVTHVHGDGCGHSFWHGAWHVELHPAGCTLCAAPAGTAVEIAVPPPSTVIVEHVHYAGCGHYFWHDYWSAYPHPAHCVVCYPGYYYGPRISVGIGLGFGGRRGGHRR